MPGGFQGDPNYGTLHPKAKFFTVFRPKKVQAGTGVTGERIQLLDEALTRREPHIKKCGHWLDLRHHHGPPIAQFQHQRLGRKRCVTDGHILHQCIYNFTSPPLLAGKRPRPCSGEVKCTEPMSHPKATRCCCIATI